MVRCGRERNAGIHTHSDPDIRHSVLSLTPYLKWLWTQALCGWCWVLWAVLLVLWDLWFLARKKVHDIPRVFLLSHPNVIQKHIKKRWFTYYFRNCDVILSLNVGWKSNQEILLQDLGWFQLPGKMEWNTSSSVFQRPLVVKSVLKKMYKEFLWKSVMTVYFLKDTDSCGAICYSKL